MVLVVLFALSACKAVEDYRFGDTMLAQQYVPGTEDLPLYNGFTPADAGNVSYDSESGRIVDASYISRDADIVEVRKFYTETLPQLGWRENKASSYTREGEKLKVSITDKGGVVFLKFVIRPTA